MVLSAEEKRQLEAFRFSMKQTGSPLSIRADRLLHKTVLRGYLETLQLKLGAPNMTVTASLLMKRYSFAAVIALYAMSAWNKRIALPLHSVHLETDDKMEQWLPAFRIDPLVCQGADADREAWRKETVEALYKEHLSPLIARLQATASISPLVLWENVAIYIFWLYDTLRTDQALAPVRGRLDADLRHVIEAMNLGRFWIKRKNEGRRMTCCLYYKTAACKHCQTCPLRPST